MRAIQLEAASIWVQDFGRIAIVAKATPRTHRGLEVQREVSSELDSVYIRGQKTRPLIEEIRIWHTCVQQLKVRFLGVAELTRLSRISA